MFKGDSFYRRSNFNWCEGKRIAGSTATAMSRGGAADGSIIRSQNVPSKTDRSCRKWGGRFMFYRCNSADPLNFGCAWRRYEVGWPCPESERGLWPAFSPNGDDVPFAPARARALLTELLTITAGAECAADHAWHDFRATVASALIGTKHSPETAQAMVCWASPASVALYGQMSMADMADAADVITLTDASRHAHLPLPHLGPETQIASAEACVGYLADDGCDDSAPVGRASKQPAASAPVDARPLAPRRGKRPAPTPGAHPPKPAARGKRSAPTPSARPPKPAARPPQRPRKETAAPPASPVAALPPRSPVTPRLAAAARRDAHAGPSAAAPSGAWAARDTVDVGHAGARYLLNSDHHFAGQQLQVPASVHGVAAHTAVFTVLGSAVPADSSNDDEGFMLRSLCGAHTVVISTKCIKPLLTNTLRQLL